MRLKISEADFWHDAAEKIDAERANN